MPELPLANNDVSEKQERLIAKIKEKGGHAGNVTLQRELGWPEDSYWPIRDRLVDAGLLELGRGRGGSVSLVIQAAPVQSDASEPAIAPLPVTSSQRRSEAELYDPLAEVLKRQWAKDLRFRSLVHKCRLRSVIAATSEIYTAIWTAPSWPSNQSGGTVVAGRPVRGASNCDGLHCSKRNSRRSFRAGVAVSQQ